MLTPGEAVLTPGAAQHVGRPQIAALNAMHPPVRARRFHAAWSAGTSDGSTGRRGGIHKVLANTKLRPEDGGLVASSRFPSDDLRSETPRACTCFRLKEHQTTYLRVRSQDDQQELWDYQAGLHGQPLPHPERGPVPLAARAQALRCTSAGWRRTSRRTIPRGGATVLSAAVRPADEGAWGSDHFEFAGMPKTAACREPSPWRHSI